MGSRTYDPESGQVFTETIMTFKPQGPWEYRCHRAANENAKAYRTGALPSQERPKTLQDLCMRKLVSHANSLQRETLENMPHDIAIRIWTTIRREWRESFHVWRVFVSARFKLQNCMHALAIRDWQRWPLIDTFSKLSSPQCAWMVDLTLSNVRLSAAEFKEVSRIENLQNLHIQHEDSDRGRDFDDRVVEAWSSRVREKGAFRYLETLSLANVPAITSDTFKHLSSFPVLDFVICAGGAEMRGKGFAKKALHHGWSQIEGRSTADHGSASLMQGKRAPTDIRDIRISRRPLEAKSAPAAARLDVELGKLDRKKGYTRPTLVLCFRREHKLAAEGLDEVVVNSAGSRKRRKMIDSKAVLFAAMLDGD